MLSLVMLEAKFDLIWAPDDAGPSKATNKGTIRSLCLVSSVRLAKCFSLGMQTSFFVAQKVCYPFTLLRRELSNQRTTFKPFKSVKTIPGLSDGLNDWNGLNNLNPRQRML